jgi:hypothetical protein
MAGRLHISEAVVTEEVLRARHAGQEEVSVNAGAVVTPTGWDYLRRHRMRLTRAQATGPGGSQPASGAVPEVLPPGAEGGLLSRGRCDHPDRPYGCKTEEFGSGFVEPSSCSRCAVYQAELAGRPSCGCGGCNRRVAAEEEEEALVQRLTDEIMRRLKEE